MLRFLGAEFGVQGIARQVHATINSAGVLNRIDRGLSTMSIPASRQSYAVTLWLE